MFDGRAIGPRMRRCVLVALFAAIGAGAQGAALAQSRNLAPGFQTLAQTARIVVMPTDIELFSISGGGILEPKADWTEIAGKHFRAALLEKKKKARRRQRRARPRRTPTMSPRSTPCMPRSRARSICIISGRALGAADQGRQARLVPGDAVRPIKEKTGADYALFSWIRDSYASGERVATMIVFGCSASTRRRHPGRLCVARRSRDRPRRLVQPFATRQRRSARGLEGRRNARRAARRVSERQMNRRQFLAPAALAQGA